MLTAKRSDPRPSAERPVIGGDALCTARLGAFFGFFHEEYSKHDYFLGRQNCREFLEKEFMLRADNPVFSGNGRSPQAQLRPVIPL
jgi:hypothetical protein